MANVINASTNTQPTLYQYFVELFGSDQDTNFRATTSFISAETITNKQSFLSYLGTLNKELPASGFFEFSYPETGFKSIVISVYGNSTALGCVGVNMTSPTDRTSGSVGVDDLIVTVSRVPL